MRATRSNRSILLLLVALGLVVSALTGCRSDDEKLADFMKRGDAYKEAEQYPEAIIEYRNALQIDPNEAAVHEALAEVYLKSGKTKEGYWELSETIRLDADNIDARLSYGAISLAAKRFEDALAQADAVIERDAENASAHLLRSQALAGLDRIDEVEPELLKAVELEPDNSSLYTVLAAHYQKLGRVEDAEKQINTAIEHEPSALLYTILGKTLSGETDRLADAETAFEKALELAATADEASESGGTKLDRAAAYRYLAGFYFKLGRNDEGAAITEKGIEEVAKDRKPDLIYLLARYWRSQGDDDRADQLLRRATEVDPNAPAPFLVLSARLGSKGDTQGALEAAESALAVDPSNVTARLRRAELLVDIGYRGQDEQKMQEGSDLVAEVLSEHPDDPGGLFIRSKIELVLGQPDVAIDTLRQVIDERPNWAQAHFVLGSALATTEDKQRARSELARAVALEPSLDPARQLLTKIHIQLGEYEYAIEQGREYLARKPEDQEMRILVAQSLARLGKLDDAEAEVGKVPEDQRGVEVFYALGRVQLARENYDAARANLLKATALQPHSAKLLKSLIIVDRATGKISHSIKRVNDAVEAAPDDADLRIIQGQLAMLTNDVEGAVRTFKNALELDPRNLDAYTQLANVYSRTGRLNETISLYEKAVKERPEEAAPHHFLGVLFEMTGKSEKAKQQYELALERDSELAATKNNLAYLLAESGGDLDRALELAQEAKAAMPDSANAADTLGWVLYKRGVASAAVGYLREAVAATAVDDPSRGVVQDHLSQAYEAAGDTEKAIDAIESALSDDEAQRKRAGQSEGAAPEPPWAVEARTRLQKLQSASKTSG